MQAGPTKLRYDDPPLAVEPSASHF
jgi:hypothetical protein